MQLHTLDPRSRSSSVDDASNIRDGYSRLYLNRRRTLSVLAPSLITSHVQFDSAVLSIAECLTGAAVAERDRFLCAMYYVLGWCVGDFGKDYGNESRLSARISFQLSKKHSENLALGEYVAECVIMLGVSCKRYGDRPVAKSNPNGSYF